MLRKIPLAIAMLLLTTILTARTVHADTEDIIEKHTFTENAPYIIEPPKNLPEEYSFVVVGDSGNGNEEQYLIAEEMFKTNPAFVVHTGDVVYMSGEWEHYLDHFVKPYAKFLKAAIPFYPVPGNHDYFDKEGDAFRAYFINLPNRYYKMRAGPIEFFMLDTNTLVDKRADKDQLEWIRRELRVSRADYKIVVMHHSLFSSGFHGSNEALINSLQWYFRDRKVSVVFSGHDHDYEHLKDEVTNYIVTGGGGGILYKKPPRDNDLSLKYVETFHFIHVTVKKDRLLIKAIDAKGKTIDSFEVRQRDW